MHTLVLLRHAKAVPADDAPSDEGRELSPRGLQEADLAGAALAAADLGVTHALVSPAVRTQQTWAKIAPHLKGVTAATIDALYMAHPEILFGQALASGGEAVLIVAHNPGLHELVRHLVDQAHDNSREAQIVRARCPTSAWSAFSLTGATLKAPGPRFLASWRPRD
jgi:phosphohistidine phosphatase